MDQEPARHETYRQLIAMSQTTIPMRVAVVHPRDEIVLGSVAEAVAIGLMDPILVGPEAKIASVAERFRYDISRYKRISTAPSHAAAAKVVELVRTGEVDAIVKSSLQTDELMATVVTMNVI